MKLNLRRAIAGAAVLAVAGGVLAAGAGVAFAAGNPPWEPDPNALGTLTLYNASGQVVTGGTSLTHLFDYAEASTADTFGGKTAYIEFAQPQSGQPTGNFPASTPSVATSWPNSAYPAPLGTATNPVAQLSSTEGNLSDFISTLTPQTATGYANVYQIRLFTTGPGGVGSANNGELYWDADVQVNSSGAWEEVYPTAGSFPATPTTTALTASPTSPATGVSTTLTASETPATAGSVEFEDGTTVLGTTAVNGSGVATLNTTFTTTGVHNLTATFTPTDTTDFSGSSGTLALTVAAPSTPTTTSLTVTQNGTTGSPISLSSTVSPAAATGTVSWYDNGSTTPLNSTPVTPTAGVATFTISAGLASGSHSIVAVFTSSNTAQYESSSSAPQQFVLQAPQTGACAQAGSQCTDTQNIEATVPVGTLVLTTPYTVANPLNLGTMALNSGLTEYSATAPFQNITVVDTRSGDLPWTLTALASNLTDGGSNAGSTICAQNVGLTAITSTAGTGFAGTVTPTSNAAVLTAPTGPGACPTTAGGLVGSGGTPVTVATTNAGLGTVTLNGTLTLLAPTSTEPNLFTGTITFTVG
jgi:Bacterial Ig-like domain (group 3)